MVSLDQNKRHQIWYELSDIFIDNEVSFEYIAKQISDVNIETLKYIFFNEVAPHCAKNLMSIIPPVWSGFNKKELIDDIEIMLKSRNNSLLFRFWVYYVRLKHKEDWIKLEKELIKNK